jgi:hypothetical protein
MVSDNDHELVARAREWQPARTAGDARSYQSTRAAGASDHHSVVEDEDPETLALLAPEPERSPLTRARARRVAHAPPPPVVGNAAEVDGRGALPGVV